MVDISGKLREGGVASANDVPGRAMLQRLQQQMFGRADSTTVNRYRIEKVLGSGGFGRVYAAFDPTLERRVALKVLPPGSGDDALLGEARAAASVNHPNVVTVHEVGKTDRGELFIAMELVEGGTLRRWGKSGQKLRHLVPVLAGAARGLVAIHEAGLVHGDIKPDNVLVRADGEALITDLGLARTVEASVGSHGGDPAATRISGTPRYMAPELHRGGRPDARSDQFAFCVMMAELVQGRHPLARVPMVDLPDAFGSGRFLAAIQGSWPRRTPGWLRRTIVRGLQVDPDARWPGMARLLAELERDRLRLVRYGAVGAVALAALGLGSVLTDPGPAPGSVCALQTREIDAIWDQRTRETVEASFEDTRLSYARNSFERVDATVRTYLTDWTGARDEACAAADGAADARQLCLGYRLTDLRAAIDVLTEADADVVTRAVEALGRVRSPGSCLTQDAHARHPVPPPEAIAGEVEAVRTELASVRALREAGKTPVARERLGALEDRVRHLEYPALEAELRFEQAWVEIDEGRYPAAAESFKSATWTAAAVGNTELAAAAASQGLNLLGYHLADPEAAELWRPTVEERMAQARPGTLVQAHYLTNLGNLHQARGEYEQAVETQEQALALKVELLGEDHPDVGRSLNNLGAVLESAGDYVKAGDYHRRARAVFESSLGPRHPIVGFSIFNLGMVAVRAHDPVAGRELLEQARTLWMEAWGDGHATVGHASLALAWLDLEAGALPACEGNLARARTGFEGSMPETHPARVEARVAEAGLRLARGDAAGAAVALAPEVRALEKSGEPGPRARAQFLLARALVGSDGDTARARELASAAAETYATLGPGWAAEAAEIRSWLADLE